MTNGIVIYPAVISRIRPRRAQINTLAGIRTGIDTKITAGGISWGSRECSRVARTVSTMNGKLDCMSARRTAVASTSIGRLPIWCTANDIPVKSHTNIIPI